MHVRCLSGIIVNHPAHKDNYKGNCSSYCNFTGIVWLRHCDIMQIPHSVKLLFLQEFLRCKLRTNLLTLRYIAQTFYKASYTKKTRTQQTHDLFDIIFL